MSSAQGICNCPAAPYIGPPLTNTCGGNAFVMFMSILDVFLNKQCDIADPCNRVRSKERVIPSYDFIVVGGGSGGAVVASRLSEVPEWNVLLLEAGGDEPPGSQVPSMVINYHGTDLDWKYKTEPEEGACLGNLERRCNWIRGKVGARSYDADDARQNNTDRFHLPAHSGDGVAHPTMLGEEATPSGVRLQNTSPVSGDTMQTSSVQPSTSHPGPSGLHLQNTESIRQLRPSVTMLMRDIPQVLGGCSVLNGMMYIRGHARDYNEWAQMGNTGWSYQEVLPYFIKSEDNLQVDQMDRGFHGVGGLLPVTQFPHHPPLAEGILRAGQELGYPADVDLNGRSYTGFVIAQTTSKNGTRYSSARAFLRPASKRPNLHVILNATATKVLINPQTKTAYGVEFLKNGQRQTAIATKEVVLSAGAMNSPQLLMLSGVGPKEELARVRVPLVHDLRGVGQNLHNHVAVFINFLVNDNATLALDWAATTEYLLQRTGPLSSTGMSQVTAKVNSKYADPSGDHPDVQIFFGGYLANCARTGTVGESEDPMNPHNRRRISLSPVVLHPKSRGYVTLKSNNPLDPPLMYANYFSDPSDMATLLDAINITLRLGNTRTLRQGFGFELDTTPLPNCISKYPFGSDGYWECYARTVTGPENHQAGSCRMGPSTDPMAVVDPELQVYGITRLRIMDASIMPMVVSGNTNAPIMMIAEKGSDMIKQKWISGDVANRFGGADGNPNINHVNTGYGPPNNGNGGGFPTTNQGGYQTNTPFPSSGSYRPQVGHSHGGAHHQHGNMGNNQGYGNTGFGSNQGSVNMAAPQGHGNRGFQNNQRQDPGYNSNMGYNNGGNYNAIPNNDHHNYQANSVHTEVGIQQSRGYSLSNAGKTGFNFKYHANNGTPMVHSGNSWGGHMNQNGHQNYWVANQQKATKD